MIVWLLLISLDADAWGKRGHAMIAEAAAYNLQDEVSHLKRHSFDLSYYANVPDLIWKRPKTNSKERREHYVNLEIFERTMKNQTWASDRKEFFKKRPELKRAGMAFWRVSEFCEDLSHLEKEIQTSSSRKTRQSKQLQWLAKAGTLGHYVGDLAQPLHTTENHDGEMTGQKGIHSFYESVMTDELYPEIVNEVIQRSRAQYNHLKSKKSQACFELIRDLASISHKEKDELLALDKKVDRKALRKAADVFREGMIQQLARGGAYLAVILSKYSQWKYDGKDFYHFEESPKFVSPRESL